MTDQQKVHGASTDEGTVRKAFATYFYDPSWKKGRPDQMDHWNTWNAAWQAALAHASSATVKENLTVGEPISWLMRTLDGEFKSVSESYAKKFNEKFDGAAFPVYTHPAPSAEDARDAASWRELCRQIDASDPVSNEASTIRNIVDDSINLGSTCLVMHIDHALAAERGEGNG